MSRILVSLLSFSLVVCALSHSLNIDGKIKCPNGETVHTIDVSIANVKKPEEVVYTHSESNNSEFCISTHLNRKKREESILTVKYACRMLTKICNYVQQTKIPSTSALKGMPFNPKFSAKETDKLSCGKLKYNPDEIANKVFMFSHL